VFCVCLDVTTCANPEAGRPFRSAKIPTARHRASAPAQPVCFLELVVTVGCEVSMSELIQVPCSVCFAVNRLDRSRATAATCGRCKNKLFPDQPAALDDATFEKYVEPAELPVVVDFWADWCGPCKMMAPQFEAAARASAGRVLFAKVDTEAAQQTASRFGIRSIPTMIVFSGGREVARQSGAMSQSQIQQWLRSVAA
jgi:thioredoxin 2